MLARCSRTARCSLLTHRSLLNTTAVGAISTLSACVDVQPPTRYSVDPLETRQGAILSAKPAGERVFYQQVRSVDEERSVVASHGAYSDYWELVYRPWSVQSLGSGFVYDEGIYERSEDGVTQTYHEVVRRPSIMEVETHATPDDTTVLGDEIADWLATAPSGTRRVIAQLHGFDEWDVPPRPDPSILSVEQAGELATRRADALRRRQQAMAPAAATAEGNDLVVVDANWVVGVLTVEGTASQVTAWLETSAEVRRLSFESVGTNNTCTCPASTYNLGTAWRQGQGRVAQRTNASTYLGQGWTGGRSNPARHSFGNIAVGVLDGGTFEDEHACLLNSSSAGSRVIARYDCSGGSCSSVGNFPDSGSQGAHGILAACAAVGDFEDGQGSGRFLDDACWASPGAHCAGFRESASGFAPEASAGLFAYTGTTTANAAALAKAIDLGLDIVVQVHDGSTGTCDIASSTASEDAIENAFDDGVFFAIAPDNYSPSASSCNLNTPGDTPKAFVVNSLNSQLSSCRSNYSSCVMHTGATGGADLTLQGGSVKVGAVTAIDMIVPGNIQYRLGRRPFPLVRILSNA